MTIDVTKSLVPNYSMEDLSRVIDDHPKDVTKIIMSKQQRERYIAMLFFSVNSAYLTHRGTLIIEGGKG